MSKALDDRYYNLFLGCGLGSWSSAGHLPHCPANHSSHGPFNMQVHFVGTWVVSFIVYKVCNQCPRFLLSTVIDIFTYQSSWNTLGQHLEQWTTLQQLRW